MWILYTPIVALTANGVLGLCLFFFITNGAELFDLLYISDDQAIDHMFGTSDDKQSRGRRSAGERSQSPMSGNDQIQALYRNQINVER